LRQAISSHGDGIAFAIRHGVWTEEQRLEYFCRMGLLGVALLHWIVFALMVQSSTSAMSTPDGFSDLAAIVLHGLALL
jgi:hypothetical protein